MRVASLWLLVAISTRAGVAQTPASPAVAPSQDDSARGQRLFDAQCARCHGIGARGGFGPNLARTVLPHAPDDSALRAVITDGIPATSMAGAWTLSPREVALIATYVRSLGRTPPEVVSGDPGLGRALYDGKGACGTCHIIEGRGAAWAPDLTGIGQRRGASYLQEALLDPGAAQPISLLPASPGGYSAYLPVVAVTREGRRIRGVRVNEDAFTIQLRDADNRFISLRKAELKQLKKEFGASPMPSYRETLSTAEIENLVAYLAGLGRTP